VKKKAKHNSDLMSYTLPPMVTLRLAGLCEVPWSYPLQVLCSKRDKDKLGDKCTYPLDRSATTHLFFGCP
jgi:hypothetical protein